MFITLVSKDHQLLAEVECRENHVAIHSDDVRLLSDLQQVYRQNMTMVEFVRANYCLNRWRANGLSWELVIASEYRSQVG